MAAHACLKNEFTEDEKHNNLMSWLITGYTLMQLQFKYRENSIKCLY